MILNNIVMLYTGWYEGHPHFRDKRSEPSLPWRHCGCPIQGQDGVEGRCESFIGKTEVEIKIDPVRGVV